MDLEALTSEQLEMTLKLSDILSMEDLTVAAAVLSSFDWNIEKATQQLQIGPIQPSQISPPPYTGPTYSSESQEFNYNDVQNQNEDVYEQDNTNQYEYLIKQKKKMFEEEYVSLLPLQKTLSEPNKELILLQNHKKLAKDNSIHRKYYLEALLNNSETLCKKILDINKEGMSKYFENKRKIENNRQFINYLYNAYKPNVNFTFGTFFLNLTRAYLEDKYLLVYIHSVAPEVENRFKKIVQLILRQKEIARFVNENCIVYGMFDNSDDYELIQKHVPLKDLPAFALFRLNKTNRTQQFISSYKISSQGDIFLQWAAKSMGIGLKKKSGSHIEQQKAVKEQVKQQQVRKKQEEAMTQAFLKKEQQKIGHRDIMKEQDQLYAEMEKTFFQKKQISLDRREVLKENQEALLQRMHEAEQEKEPQPGPEVIEIRFRMPVSGQSKVRHFKLGDKVEKLFKYIDCFCRNQFQQKFAEFDLRQSFPQLSLLEKKDKTIDEIFEGSLRQNIIIREL